MRVRLLTSVLMIGAAVAVAGLPAAPSLAQQKKGHGHADHKHNHPTAQHGGILEDVGEFHVELVAKDGKITLYLRDHEAKDAATEGFKASVLITAGSQRIGPVELKPSGSNKLEGPVAAVPAGATAILTLTDKGGTAAQGRFKLQ
ncbi:MAG: hypothetical protein ACKVP7_00065 [Hyphomicrobiaceae bacterium]